MMSHASDSSFEGKVLPNVECGICQVLDLCLHTKSFAQHLSRCSNKLTCSALHAKCGILLCVSHVFEVTSFSEKWDVQ